MTVPLTGMVDGMALDRFQPGFVYRVGTVMASYLFAMGAAEPVPFTDDASVLAPTQRLFARQPGRLPGDAPAERMAPAKRPAC